ncbi:MAG: hypothetical protein IT532_06180 [Burkholderiales bacterium]|nr:hypothetical protein [Burkholderiales bacterium]
MNALLAGLALAALALPAPSLAADWTRVAVKDQHEHYYDRAKLAIDGELITYWRRVVFRPAQATRNGLAATAMYRERIDCALHNHRTLGYLLYAQDGSVLENVYTPEAAPEPIIPETLGDRFEGAMCALVTRERSRNVGRRTPDRPPEKPVAEPAADATQRTMESAASRPDPARMNENELLTEIARLEERLAQLRAQVDAMRAPAPVAGETPPLRLPDPLLLQDDQRAAVLPPGTPTP